MSVITFKLTKDCRKIQNKVDFKMFIYYNKVKVDKQSYKNKLFS